MCTPLAILQIPDERLNVTIDVDRDQFDEEALVEPLTFPRGRPVPVIIEVSAGLVENVTEPVQITWTIPNGVSLSTMTVPGVDQALLDAFLIALDPAAPPTEPVSLGDNLSAAFAGGTLTFTYNYQETFIVGNPSPFQVTLDIVGNAPGPLDLTASAQIEGAPTPIEDGLPLRFSFEDTIDIALELVEGTTAPSATDTLTYILTVTNPTELALRDIQLTTRLFTLLNETETPAPTTLYDPVLVEPVIPGIEIVPEAGTSSATITIPDFPAGASQTFRVVVSVNGYNYRSQGYLIHQADIIQVEDAQGELGTSAVRLPQGLGVTYSNGFEVTVSQGEALVPAIDDEFDLNTLDEIAQIVVPPDANFNPRQASYRLTGWITVPSDGTFLEETVDNSVLTYSGIRVWVSGQLVYSRWAGQTIPPSALPVADVPQPIYIETYFFVPPETLAQGGPAFSTPVLAWNDPDRSFNEALSPFDAIGNVGTIVMPTPGTNEAEQPGAMAHYATCPVVTAGIRRIQLVPVFTGQGQETFDMHAVAEFRPDGSTPTGLIIHDGPTWNAVQFGVIPWGTVVSVDRRMVFEQTGDIADQVWYRLARTNPNENDQWIALRMPGTLRIQGTNAIQSFVYAVGIGDVDLDEDQFCGGDTDDIGSEDKITFTYDRLTAAEYGMAYGYRNSIPQSETTEGVFPGNNRATRRTDVTSISDFNGQPVQIPYLQEVPFADFQYNYIQHGVSGSTASAVHLSESIWVGGLPMTHNIDTASVVDRVSRCATTLVNPDPSTNLGIAGWRHCDEESGNSTRVWRTHQGIICYYSQSHDFFCSNEQEFVNINGVLPAIEHGEFLGSLALRDPVTGAFRQDIESITGDILTEGFLDLDDFEGAQEFYEAFIATIPNITLVEIGDYVFTDRNSASGHGYLVAGWGSIMSCPTAYSKIWRYETVPAGQENVYGQLTFYEPGLTPYVVDFPGSIDVRQTQRPRPRPFYCAPYDDLELTFSQDVNDDLSFYKILSDSSLAILSEQVYTSLSWNWSE